MMNRNSVDLCVISVDLCDFSVELCVFTYRVPGLLGISNSSSIRSAKFHRVSQRLHRVSQKGSCERRFEILYASAEITLLIKVTKTILDFEYISIAECVCKYLNLIKVEDVMSEYKFEELTSSVLGLAIEVHRHLGPGLLESIYEECLAYELENAGISFERQKPIPIIYKEIVLDKGYRIDLLVEEKVVIEIKSVEALNIVHEAQILTHMKLAEIPVGLLLNFNVTSLRKGIRRFVM